MLLSKPHVIDVLSPADITTSDTGTAYINVGKMHWLTFALIFGAADGTSIDITVQCSSASTSNSGEHLVAFKYRLLAAAGTDTMTAPTAVLAATATGYTAAGSALTLKTVLVDVDPADITADHNFVRCNIVGSSGNNIVGALALCDLRESAQVPASSMS